MLLRKLTKNGHSHSLNLPPDFLRELDVDPQRTLLEVHLGKGCLIIRPRRTSVRPKQEADVPVLDLVRQLDARGMNPALFTRISADGMTLGEFAGRASLELSVDPVTVARLTRCLERRRRCESQETWSETLDAVLAESTESITGSGELGETSRDERIEV